MTHSLDTVALPDHVFIESGPGGLPCLHLRGKGGKASILLHGAHVIDFEPEGEDPVLWMSAKSEFRDGTPVRGGIPVCWPWFGPHSTDASLPAHGVARLRAWSAVGSKVLEDGRVQLTLAFTPTAEEGLPDGLRLELTLRVGRTLELELDSINEGTDTVEIEDALHAYFRISGIEDCCVKGLEGSDYLDKLDGMSTKTQSGLIRFEAETDRVYQDGKGVVELVDELSGRRILLEQSGAANRVVWNPWIKKSAAMPDFGDDEWKEMCCVETANCLKNRIHLAPGSRHRTRLKISCQA